MAAVLNPRFYLLIALALVTFVVVGFAPSYYLRILTDPPPLTTLLHIHAVVFTVWMALFLAQVGLVAAHRVDLHRKLGIASAIFAGVVVAVGVLSVFQTAISNHVSPSGLAPPQFSIVGFTSIGLFAVFIGLGLVLRRRPGLHRRFMILGFIASISPASGAEFSLLPAQNATGNWVKIVQRIPVRLAIDDSGNGPVLRAGMSANVEIDTGKQNSLLGRLQGGKEPAPQVKVAVRD